MTFGPWEIAIVLLILAIIFGVGRLALIGSALGKSVRDFRGAVQDKPRAAPVVPVSVPQVICAECQASNPVTNRFCSKCGATMRPAEATATPALAEAAPEPPQSGAPQVAESATSATHPPVAAAPASEAPEPASEVAPIDAGRTVHTPAILPQNTCPSCATVNPPGQPFCGQCGTRLKPAAA
jgi:TatA/E family protein of Tat protein translocase